MTLLFLDKHLCYLISCSKQQTTWHFQFDYFIYFRSGLFTDILLVLIVSITCVQTKEIKNSSDFQEISAIKHTSTVDSSTSEPGSNSNHNNNHAHDNHNSWPHPPIDIAATTNATHISIDIDHQPISSHPNDSSDAQIPHSKYFINNRDQIEISSNNELNKSELPTPIESDFKSNTVHTEQITERHGKESNILRSALRVAARQGLEAMTELYDKKEPNLIRKGEKEYAIFTLWIIHRPCLSNDDHYGFLKIFTAFLFLY